MNKIGLHRPFTKIIFSALCYLLTSFYSFSQPASVNFKSGSATSFVELYGNDKKGQIGKINRPFASIDAALAALPADGGIVYIGLGDFNAPSRDKLKSNVSLIGRKKPVPNWEIGISGASRQVTTTNPTRLTGGTVLKGTLDCSLLDNITIQDLGVDAGLDWCKVRNNGDAMEGLIFAQKYNLKGGLSGSDGIHELQEISPPKFGITVTRVAALCRDAEARVHAMLFENLYAPKINDVSTYFGTHGLVMKTIGGQLNNLDGHGHASNGLIIKSNDYAHSRSVNVANVYITSINTNDGGGIRLQGENQGLEFVTITNFSIEHTAYGIINSGKVAGATLSNGTIFGTKGQGISFDHELSNSVVSNIILRQSGDCDFKLKTDKAGTSNALQNIQCY